METTVKHWRQGVEGSKVLQFLLVTMMALALVTCSEDDENGGEFDYPLEGSELSMADIAGNWTATSAEFQVVGQPGSAIEIVGAGGRLTLNIQDNGRFSSIVGFPGEDAVEFTGQLGFSGSQLVLLDDVDEPGDEAFINIDLTSEDLLLLSGVLEFDVDGNGSFEATDVDAVLTR